MTVIKRNGSEVAFDITKIIAAITKANESVDECIRMTPMQIQRIAESVEFSCLKMNRSPSVEEIQDLVEYQIMAHGAFEVAKNYVTYRYTRSLVRQLQHHRREDPLPDRVLQRGGQAGKRQQEPGGEFHPAGLHGRRGEP